MKNRLNITIDETLVEQAKRHAAKHNTSLSRLIEQYLKLLVSHRPNRKEENILEILDRLPKPKGDVESYSQEAYYEKEKHKYGF